MGYYLTKAIQSLGDGAVQHECIPQAILGMDVICQAKSGMGKTAVFVLSTLQQIEPLAGQVAALVLCHTRELAYQVNHSYPISGVTVKMQFCPRFTVGADVMLDGQWCTCCFSRFLKMQMTVPVIQTAPKFCFWSCFLFTLELGFLFFMLCCLAAWLLLFCQLWNP